MFKDGDVIRHVLPNGLKLLVRRDTSAPVAAIVTCVRAGYFDEPDEVGGIAHVLEHMLFKGTPTRGVGEIARQTKACGGYLNASTIYDHTRYYAVVPSASFEEALEIQGDAWANSALDAGELARELEVIIEEARRKSDTPEAVTTETLFELLHDRHRIRRWRIGHPEVLRALRHEQLNAFYRRYYQPSNTLLSIVGDVEVSDVIQAVERVYGPAVDHPVVRDRGPRETGLPGQRVRQREADITQAHGAFGWRAPDERDPDALRLDLAASVLSGGRTSYLYRAIRERRLASSIAAWNYTPEELGVFVVQWSGDPAQRDAVAREAWAVVRHFPERLSQGDLERARRLHASRTLRRFESMDGQANYLADWEALGGWERGRAYEERVQGATVQEVAEAAARHLVPDQASWMRLDPARTNGAAPDADTAFRALEGGEGVKTVPMPAALVPRGSEHPGVTHEGRTRDVDVYRTAGNVPVLVRVRPGAPMVHLALYAAGGAAADPDGRDGLATLLSRSALKGTARRTALEISAASELAGGVISPSVTADGIGWGISVPSAQLGEALDLLLDVALRPTFDEGVLDTERAIALQQVAQLRDDMYRYPARLAMAAAFAGHPYARSAPGSEEGLTRCTVGDLRTQHEGLILRGDIVLAVTGDVDAQRFAEDAAAALAPVIRLARPPLEAPLWSGTGAFTVEGRAKAQTAITMAFPGPSRSDPARFVARVLAAVTSGLGGRFFDELREKRSLAYTVQAGPVVRARAGVFTAYIATSPAREDEAREGLLREFQRLREEPVTDDELARARQYTAGTHAIASQDPGHMLDELVDAWMYGTGLDEPVETEARLRAVTAADILALAARSFDADRRAEGVVRGRQTAPNAAPVT